MIELEVVTPERRMLKLLCQSVTLPGSSGELEVLEGHTPVLTGLKTGVLSYCEPAEIGGGKGNIRIMVAEGFAEIDHNRVTVLSDAAVFASEVNVQTEQDLIQRLNAQKTQLGAGEEAEFRRIEAEIERAAAKIRIV